jgi:tRNA (mo5U34)-methyltransferase
MTLGSTEATWAEVAPHVPQDLAGWRALDVGCNAGFYSLELARRGAHVVGLDLDEHYLAEARRAAERFGLADRVEVRRGTVFDLARAAERWDLVLCMGILDHVRYPLLALDLVARVVDRLLVLQTLTLAREERAEPLLAFVERRLANDATSWWTPNAAAVEAMARSAGLEVVAHPGEETWLYRPAGPFAHDAELSAATGR